jgi:signal peptidase II
MKPEASSGRLLGHAGWIAGLVLLLDQASKWMILEEVMRPPRVIEVSGFFNLVLTFNTGISFGLLNGAGPWKPLLLSLLALLIVTGLFVWLWRQPSGVIAVSVGLIAGGALGNALWAFNLADAAISLGVVLLVYDSLFLAGRDGKRESEAPRKEGST